MIKVRLKGDLISEFNSILEKATEIKADQLVKVLQENTPVDTGKAQAGWYHDKKTIRNDVDYLSFLNDGSSEQAPTHFIERTLLSQKGILPNGTIVREI